MFTGLIESQGVVTNVQRVAGGAQLQVYAPEFGRDMIARDCTVRDGQQDVPRLVKRGADAVDEQPTLGHPGGIDLAVVWAWRRAAAGLRA